MAKPIGTPIRCPQCGQPFSAVLEQVIDVGRDPQAKGRLLGGRLNMVTCPHCGTSAALQTPLLYHDPKKELLIAYVPMELNIPSAEQERIIGDMQRSLMDSLPPEERKGYLFTPRTALTRQGLVDQILEADGITAEMRQAQQARMDLLQKLMEAEEDQLPALVQEHDSAIDAEFFQLLGVSAQVMAQQGQGALAERMSAVGERLLELSTAGREIKADMDRQDAAVKWAQEALSQLGERATREQLVDVVVAAADDEDRIDALVAMAWPAFDYQFFQTLTARAERSPEGEREKLLALRETLLESARQMQEQSRAAVERALATLNALMSAEDLDAAVRERLDEVDSSFMAVLSSAIQDAREKTDLTRSARLRQIYDTILDIMQEGAPPEVQFVNALMSAPDDETTDTLIQERAGQLDPSVLELMDVLVEDLQAQGHNGPAERLTGLRDRVAEALGSQAAP